MSQSKRTKSKLRGTVAQSRLMASIPLSGFALFTAIPLLITIVTMFVEMDGYDFSTMKWNHFENFKTVFTDEKFFQSLGVTLKMIIPHIAGLLISLLISAMLAQHHPGHKFFKAAFFIPYICSTVAISVMWRWMFDQNTGILNDLVIRLTGENGPQWFNDAASYTAMLLTVMIWQAPAYGIVMFTAAFTNVNRSLYEAADLDGASELRKFFSITIPAISPTIFYLLIAGLIAGLQTFDVPQIFNGDSWTGDAGPQNAGLTTMIYIYQKGIMFSEMPVASVMSMVLFLITLVIMIVNFKLSEKWVSYDV